MDSRQGLFHSKLITVYRSACQKCQGEAPFDQKILNFNYK